MYAEDSFDPNVGFSIGISMVSIITGAMYGGYRNRYTSKPASRIGLIFMGIFVFTDLAVRIIPPILFFLAIKDWFPNMENSAVYAIWGSILFAIGEI